MRVLGILAVALLLLLMPPATPPASAGEPTSIAYWFVPEGWGSSVVTVAFDVPPPLIVWRVLAFGRDAQCVTEGGRVVCAGRFDGEGTPGVGVSLRLEGCKGDGRVIVRARRSGEQQRTVVIVPSRTAGCAYLPQLWSTP